MSYGFCAKVKIKHLLQGNLSVKKAIKSADSLINSNLVPEKQDVPSTTRKGRVAGTQEYTNNTTGEVKEFNVISVEDCDANFQKIWLSHILMAIDEIGNAKMQILAYLLKTRYPGNNTLIKTVREIAKETKTSVPTVVKTLQALEEHKIISRKSGSIILNPDVIFKGGHKHRMNVLIEYHHFAEDNEIFEEEENVIKGKFPTQTEQTDTQEVA